MSYQLLEEELNMIQKISLKSNINGLAKFHLENLPSLMVLTGANGSGKTIFLKQLAVLNTGKMPANFDINCAPSIFTNQVLSIPVGYVPGELVQGNQDPRSQSENRTRQIISYIHQGKWANVLFNKVSLAVLGEIDPTITQLDANASLFAKTLSEEKILEVLPIDIALIMQNFTNNDFISEICFAYQERYDRLKLDYYDKGQIVNHDKLVNKLGAISPWDTINRLFKKYGFGYQLSAPQKGVQYTPRFLKNESQQKVQFQFLSSGEKILVTLVLWAFNSHQSNHSKLLLLDEFDAHLNPSLAKMMMEIISDTLIKKHGLQVIMSTHSPSTVSYTNDENLFWLEANIPIRGATKAEIIPKLTDGYVAISTDSLLGQLEFNAETNKKPILCVEGASDKSILETAWEKLYGDLDMPFVIVDVFDCYFIVNMFKRGDIFNNHNETIFLGLLDFDAAYKDAKEKLPKIYNRVTDNEPEQAIFIHKKSHGAVMTLPVPKERDAYAATNISNSYLSIELLFSDELIKEFCTDLPIQGNASLLKFCDKHKSKFSKLVENFPKEAFVNFEPLFKSASFLIAKLRERSQMV